MIGFVCTVNVKLFRISLFASTYLTTFPFLSLMICPLCFPLKVQVGLRTFSWAIFGVVRVTCIRADQVQRNKTIFTERLHFLQVQVIECGVMFNLTGLNYFRHFPSSLP